MTDLREAIAAHVRRSFRVGLQGDQPGSYEIHDFNALTEIVTDAVLAAIAAAGEAIMANNPVTLEEVKARLKEHADWGVVHWGHGGVFAHALFYIEELEKQVAPAGSPRSVGG